MKKAFLFIAILSGLVVSLNSCTTVHHCSAYSQIDTNNNDVQQNISATEEEI